MIGLFFVGIGVTFVGFLIAWYVINRWVLKDD
jgi:divalent metal cation (Fe/Co/Zn/Cd) transporter